MKILVISSLFPPHVLGGYAIICEQVCRELQKLGDELHVLTSDHGTNEPFVELENIHVTRTMQHLVPFSRPPGKRHTRWRRSATVQQHNYEQAKKMLADLKPDVVFVWSQLRLTLGAARAAQDRGLPVVYALNDTYLRGYTPSKLRLNPRSWPGFLFDRFIFPDGNLSRLNLRFATCISACLKQQLLELGVPIEGARVIYQGIPIERFPAKEAPGHIENPARLLYVGQLLNDKGVHTLLEAINWINENAPSTNLTVTIVGGGPEAYCARLRDLAAENVRFLGKIPNADLPGIYRDHDVFIFPSIWREPFGLTQLEAMASGLTAICTTDGGHGECIIDRENALAFEKQNHVQLAERILELIQDETLSKRLAKNARKMVEEEYTIARYAASLRDFLLEAQEAKKARQTP